MLATLASPGMYLHGAWLSAEVVAGPGWLAQVVWRLWSTDGRPCGHISAPGCLRVQARSGRRRVEAAVPAAAGAVITGRVHPLEYLERAAAAAQQRGQRLRHVLHCFAESYDVLLVGMAPEVPAPQPLSRLDRVA